MAKRRTTTRKTTRRRRRSVGALDTSNIMSTVGGVMIGVVAAGWTNKMFASKMSPAMQAIIPIGAGLFVPNFIQSDFGKFAGAGLIAYGAGKFLASKGLGADTDLMTVPFSINGAGDMQIIAGDGDLVMAGDGDYVMAGDDDDDVMAGDISVLAGLFDEDQE